MSGHDVWHTPPELFAVLDAEFGFRLDAACHKGNCLAPLGISEEIDALKTAWNDPRIDPAPQRTVYCNPPYSKLGAFVERSWDQCQKHKLTVVLLIPAYTDPGYWWNVIVPFADEIRFLRGRVGFLENGESRQSARFPSVVIVFRYRKGIAKGSPRVWWWDWKAETDPAVIAPLFSTEASA